MRRFGLAKPRIATIFTPTVDPKTDESTNGGLGPKMPDLYAIGVPEPLSLPG